MTTVDLSWNDNSNSEDGFKIEKSADGGSTWTQIADVSANTTSYSDIGVPNGTHSYRVYAYNVAGDSGYSNESTVEIDAVVRSAIDLTATAVSSTEYDLSWNDRDTNNEGYRIYLSDDGGSTFTQQGGDLAPDTTSYSLTGLSFATDYVAKVVTFNSTDIATDDHVDSGTMTVSGTKTVKYTEIVQL